MGVASQEGYRVRREEGEDSALAKAETHGGQERLLERHLERASREEEENGRELSHGSQVKKERDVVG